MTLWDTLIHLLNFAAPALVLALLLPLAGRFVTRVSGQKRTVDMAWLTQAAVHSVAGLAVLAAGLWFFGRDGKMATYAALVLVMATNQWLMTRGWRR
jgi:hypothetical protein